MEKLKQSREATSATFKIGGIVKQKYINQKNNLSYRGQFNKPKFKQDFKPCRPQKTERRSWQPERGKNGSSPGSDKSDKPFKKQNSVDKGLSYGSIKTYKSALSLVIRFLSSDDYIFQRFLKGIYNMRPPTTRYSITWDPYPVLRYLEGQFPFESLTLEKLSQKIVTLLALTSADRTSMAADRLNALAPLYAHRDIDVDINQVISLFASKKRRLDFVT
nr:unnamed protein product [Callosobruchus analis]